MTLTKPILQAATGLIATANGGGPVNVTWSATGGTARFDVFRSTGGSYQQAGSAICAVAGSAACTSFSDSTAAPNAAYLYKVQAADTFGQLSAMSNFDLAVTVRSMTHGRSPVWHTRSPTAAVSPDCRCA